MMMAGGRGGVSWYLLWLQQLTNCGCDSPKKFGKTKLLSHFASKIKLTLPLALSMCLSDAICFHLRFDLLVKKKQHVILRMHKNLKPETRNLQQEAEAKEGG